MTWVKICGITNLEDALTAVDAGADALGFVFYEKSPRNLLPETARDIIGKLPESVEKVGVFVGNYPQNFIDLIRNVCLTAAQLHFAAWSPPNNKAYGAGCFPPRFNRYLSVPATLFIENKENANNLISGHRRMAEFMRSHSEDGAGTFAPTIFLDTSTPQQPGGSGTPFDWQKAAPIVREMNKTIRIVVAGGLTPSNVSEAMRVLQPWGVDVSSGVEASPGKKDPDKVRAFVAAVRREDQKH